MRGVLTGRGRMFAAGVASVVSGALLASLVVTPGVAAPADNDDTSVIPGGVTLGDSEVDDRDQNVDGLEEPVEAEESFSARLTAVSSGRRVEDVSQRTESTRTYANPDGTWTLEDLGEPAYVQGEDGQWQDVDLTLVKRGDGTWGPKVSPTDVTIGGGDVVSVVLNEEESRTATLTWPEDLPEPTVEGPVATFAVSDTSDLVVTATPVGATYVLRLNEAPAQIDPVFDFDVVTQGVSLETSGSSLTLVDEQGKVAGQSVPLVAWDASIDRAGDPANVVVLNAQIDSEVANKKTGEVTSTLSLEAPESFLTDADTQYPVIIDPAIAKVTSAGDTWVRSGLTTPMGGASYLVVGRTNADHNGDARTYLKWDVSKLYGYTITKATVNLYQYDAGTCGTVALTNAHPLAEPFNTSTTVWTNKPAANTSSGGSSSFTLTRGRNGCTGGLGNGWVDIDVKTMVQNWANKTVTNHGLVLNAPTANKDNVAYGKRFCSWNEDLDASACNTSARSPYLSVTYSKPLTAPSAPTFASTNVPTWSNTSPLVLTSKGADSLGEDVKYTIEIRDSANKSVKSCTTKFVTHNTLASCEVTGLAAGSYKAYARTTNVSELSSGWSSATTLNYDRAAPASATITASAYTTSGLWLDKKPASNTFTFRSSSTDVQRFNYQFSNGPTSSVTASNGVATLVSNPAGSYTLKVVAVDRAGNTSGTSTFIFGNGGASMSSPTSAGVKTTSSVSVRATAPSGGLVANGATLYWRLRGTSNTGDNTSAGSTTGWEALTGTSVPVSTSGDIATANTVFDAASVAKTAGGVDRSRKHTVFDVQVCFTYSNPNKTLCTWTNNTPSRATVTYVPHAFGSNFPVTDAGPGQVAQWTGEFNTSTTDISVPGYLGELTVSRSFSTFNSEQDGPFGWGWKPSFDGVDAGVAGFEIVDDTAFDGTILLVDEEENALIYSQGASKTAQKVGTYTAVDDETAQVGARLEIKDVSGTKKLIFTEDDGTVTTWTHAGAGVWKPESVMVAGDPSATRFVHDGQGRLKQIIAPQPVGVTCAPPSFAPGCRVLTLEYGNTAGEKKVQSVAYTAYDQSSTLPTKMETRTVAQYTYNNDGYLIEVKDPRSNLSTSYTYASGKVPNVTRLTSVKPSGLDAYTIEYKPGGNTSDLFTDGVTAVKRGSTYTDAFTYDLSVSDSKLPRMEKADVGKWGQETAPTKVFAAFGQDSAGAARSSVTADLLKKADITYTDDEGRVINTASYSGGGGGGETARWLYTATGFDSAGNVIRELDERGIDQILAIRTAGGAVNPDEYATITRYNPDITTASAVTWGSGDGVTTIPAGTVVTPTATLVTDVWEPVREIVDGDGQVTLARQHTVTTYDQGAPNQGINPETGLPFRLATTTRVTLAQPASASSDPSVALPTDEPVLTEQRMGYDPVDGASVTGKTSGWMIGAPTTTTTENGDQDITVKSVFDEQGRTVKEIGADSNGTDAGTTVTHYYDARPAAQAPAGLPSQCANTPAWAGLLCQTTSGEATPSIPVETVTQYSYYLAAAVTTESLDGVTRTATTTFDGAGRVEKTTTTVTGLASSTPQPTVKNVYDPATGLQTETQTLGSGDSVTASVKTQHDAWGRVVKYTDDNGQATATTYDSAGRVATETSPKFGNTTYTYDPYSGSVIGKQIAGVGEFTAHYNAFGDIVSQTLPTGVVQASSYDRSGQETSLSYTVTGDEGEASFAWTMHHDALGRINQITGPVGVSHEQRVTRYEFDQAARMTGARDELGDWCINNNYTFDTVGRRTKHIAKTSWCNDAGTPSTSSKTWSYDKADRLLSGANGVGSYVYDALGRQTSLPSVDTPHSESAGDLTVSYYDSDLARSVTQNGVTTTYDLDVMDRRSISTTTQGSDTSTTTRVYEDTSDNPSWATTVKDGVTETTRYVSSIAGDLSLTFSVEDEFLSTGIVDPQGSVVATTKLQDVDGGTTTVWSGLSFFDEYGNRINSQTTNTGAINYGWLGGKERATETTGLVLMGVRLYNSVTGHFTSVDPVKDGNTTRYAYPQDPINQLDLDGKASWWSRNWKKVAVGAAVVVAVGATCYFATAACGVAVRAGTQVVKRVATKSAVAATRGARVVQKVSQRTTVAAKKTVAKAYQKTVGPQSRLFGNTSLGAKKPGLLNNSPRGSGKPALGWSVKRTGKVVHEQFRYKSKSGKHYDLIRGKKLN